MKCNKTKRAGSAVGGAGVRATRVASTTVTATATAAATATTTATVLSLQRCELETKTKAATAEAAVAAATVTTPRRLPVKSLPRPETFGLRHRLPATT